MKDKEVLQSSRPTYNDKVVRNTSMCTASLGAAQKEKKKKKRHHSQGHTVQIKKEHTRFALILLVFFWPHTRSVKENGCSERTYSSWSSTQLQPHGRMGALSVFMCARNLFKQRDLLLMGRLSFICSLRYFCILKKKKRRANKNNRNNTQTCREFSLTPIIN